MSLVKGMRRRGAGIVKWFCLVFGNKMIMISFNYLLNLCVL